MRLTTLLLKFMMSGRPFQEDDFRGKEKKSKNTDSLKGGIYETKTDYIGKVTGFLEDGIKQMKKDLSI